MNTYENKYKIKRCKCRKICNFCENMFFRDKDEFLCNEFFKDVDECVDKLMRCLNERKR